MRVHVAERVLTTWLVLDSSPSMAFGTADRRKAAWLYLQFINSKTVSLKKSHVGLTFTRESDIWDKSFTERAPKLGGLIEFYRSPARVQWTPTGNNVPDYPKLAQLWWQNIGDASSGAKTPQAAMDALAAAQDSVLERLEKSGVQKECGPKLNKKETEMAKWSAFPHAGDYSFDTASLKKSWARLHAGDCEPQPKDAKVLLAKEITARFHNTAAADAAEQDFINRSRGGVPDDIPEVALGGAPLGIGALLKSAGLAPSTSEANRLIDGGGVRVDSSVVSDKGLKLPVGTYVVQVGKRKFARIHLA